LDTTLGGVALKSRKGKQKSPRFAITARGYTGYEKPVHKVKYERQKSRKEGPAGQIDIYNPVPSLKDGNSGF